MGRLDIPRDALIFFGDGRKAVFLRNAGDEKFLNLKSERVASRGSLIQLNAGSDRRLCNLRWLPW